MKKIITLFLVCMMLVSSMAVFATGNNAQKPDNSANAAPALAPNSKTAVVIDMTSDYILFDKDKDKKMYPASMTKLMTALLTIENKSLADTTVVSQAAVDSINKYESTNVDLKVGDVETVDELLHAILIPSANDAAYVLAEFVGGSEANFVKMMNEKARELGCKNTNFVNASGLHDNNHYTTAYDMAIISKAAISHPEIAKIVGEWSFVMQKSGYTYASTNHLVSRYVYLDYYYENATGIKTGYTDEAQRTLAASATDGEHTIIAVVMGCPDKKDGTFTSYPDAKQLFQYYFANNSNHKYIAANQIVEERKVKNAVGDGRILLTTPVTKEAYLPNTMKDSDITYDVHLQAELKAPIKKNQKMGYANVLYKGTKISSIELCSDREISKSYFKAFFNAIGGFKLLIVLLVIFVIIFIVLLAIRQRNLYLRKKRRQERMLELKQKEEEEKNEFKRRNL